MLEFFFGCCQQKARWENNIPAGTIFFTSYYVEYMAPQWLSWQSG